MGLMTGAGRRDKVVQIQQPLETRGTDYSDPQTVWSTLGEVWASIEPLTGREYAQNREQQTQISVRIRMLYVAGITSKMRVVWRDKVYQIVSVISPFEDDQELELMCSDFEQEAE